MPRVSLEPSRSVLVVVDIQPSFMKAIHDAERVLARASFLVQVARLLEIPVLATEQNVSRMGGTDPEIARFLSGSAHDKMCFSCCGSKAFMRELRESGRNQAVLVEIETHICVSQTALHLVEEFDVVVCPDAVSARTVDRHKLGMERMRDGGVVPAHTEAVAYEWLGSADSPKFREALAIVKQYA